jgi:hypothetical protein
MVEDAAGHVGRRTVVIRAGHAGPDTTRTLTLKNPRSGDDRFEFSALPKGYLRVTYRGAKAGTKGVRIGLMQGGQPRPGWSWGKTVEAAATQAEDGWVAVLPAMWANGSRIVEAWGRTPEGKVVRDGGPGIECIEYWTFDRRSAPPFDWQLPQEARFDSSIVIFRPGTLAPKADGELVRGKAWFYLGPETEPLRGAVRLSIPTSDGPHFGLYRRDEDGWSWIGNRREEIDHERHHVRYMLESRRLGWFAEFEDTLAPRIALRTPPRHAAKGPYNRWGVEAALVERGSGIDSRACYFVVDGKKVAAEWDPEAGVLRWRPLAAPKAGTHKYDVVAGDHAGNTAIRSGTFVLD